MTTTPTLPTTAPDTEEEAAVRETAREIASRCDGDHLACWDRLMQAGFVELRTPDENGEPMASTTMTALVVQELAGAVCGAPLLGTLLAAELVRLAGGAPLGEPATVLLSDDLGDLAGPSGVVWDAAAPVTRAIGLDGDELVSVPVTDDRSATQDLSRFVARPGGEAGRLGLRLDAPARDRFLSFARLVLAADLLGASASVLAGAVGYAGDRVQFGKPIGTFQAVQHLCARAYSEVEAIRSAILHGAWALDAGQEHVEAALVAKAYAGGAGISVVEAAVQVYGGVAITWEFPAHRHLRRVLLDNVVLGDPEVLGEQLLAVVDTQTVEA